MIVVLGRPAEIEMLFYSPAPAPSAKARNTKKTHMYSIIFATLILVVTFLLIKATAGYRHGLEVHVGTNNKMVIGRFFARFLVGGR